MRHYQTRIIIARTVMTVLALFCCAWAWAEDVTAEQALQQAQAFVMNHQTANGARRAPGNTAGGDSQSPTLTLAAKVSGLYVFNVDGDGGYVVVSNDDRTTPILGYGENGTFSTADMPSNMRAWLQGYADEIAWLQQQGNDGKTYKKAPKPHKIEVSPLVKRRNITPLVSTRWDQDAPYNNLCPEYQTGYKSATGCVATAMAQVMKYHEWPTAQTATIPGYETYSYGLYLSSLPATTFDWANMKDSYSGGYTTAQANAVAKLMKYCGWSVEMDYGPSSGSNTDLVAIALKDYFDYNSTTTEFVTRSQYTYAEWTQLIYHELDHDRPVVYGGMSTGGGHEFVCDGYKMENSAEFFHINWGWSGLSDNYFVLSALDPYEQGIGGSSSTDGFHYGQDAVIGIQPSTGTGTTANITPHTIDLTLNSITLSKNPIILGESVDITVNVTNNSADVYDGDIMVYEQFLKLDIQAQTFVIQPGETKECVFTVTPTELGTYSLVPLRNDFYYFEEPQVHKATLEVVEEMAELPDGLTVYDGTVKNQKVPAYIYYFDDFTRSQFIIPASELAEMEGGTINSLSFYTADNISYTTDSNVDVYLKEVSYTTISAFEAKVGCTTVYQGKLEILKSMDMGLLTITFTTPYVYEGGNLLIGIENTTDAGYKNVSFYGQTVSGASVGGSNANSLSAVTAEQQNFIPKTTFGYEPASGIVYRKPTHLTTEDVMAQTAILSWIAPEGDVTGYAYQYKPADDETWQEAVVTTATTATLNDLTPVTAYDFRVKALYGDNASGYVTTTFTTAFSDDMCSITLELTDKWGDSWNGAGIKIVDVASGYVIGTFANENLNGTQGSGEYEVNTISVAVPDNRDIRFVWVSGSFDSECSWVVYDVNGNTIFSGQGNSNMSTGKVLHTYHVDCTVNITLNDAATDNSAVIAQYDGKHANVTLSGRTLYKDGAWNTLCLPFSVALEGSPLEGATAKTLAAASLTDAHISMTFGEAVDELEAGVPYIIKWDSGTDLTEADLVFNGVTIETGDDNHTIALADGNVQFTGYYDAFTIVAADEDIYYMTAENKLKHTGKDRTLKACRAFFRFTEAATAREFVLDFGEGGTTTIEGTAVDVSTGDIWYGIDGVKHDKRPTRKGLYIRNGKKVVF